MGCHTGPTGDWWMCGHRRGHPDGWLSLAAQTATGATPWPLCNIDTDSIMSLKSAYRRWMFSQPCYLTQPFSFRQRRSLSSCWIAVISVRATIQYTPRGAAGSAAFPFHKDIRLRSHTNGISVLLSNLCLRVFIWMSMSVPPTCVCVCVCSLIAAVLVD